MHGIINALVSIYRKSSFPFLINENPFIPLVSPSTIQTVFEHLPINLLLQYAEESNKLYRSIFARNQQVHKICFTDSLTKRTKLKCKQLFLQMVCSTNEWRHRTIGNTILRRR